MSKDNGGRANGNGNGKKPVLKTASETATRPGKNGGRLLVAGVPGNRGGGRPKKAFKAFLAELREDPAVQQAIEKAAKDADAKNFKAALDVLVRYDVEKPAEQLDVNHRDLSDEQREAKVLAILTQAKTRKERGLVS